MRNIPKKDLQFLVHWSSPNQLEVQHQRWLWPVYQMKKPCRLDQKKQKKIQMHFAWIFLVHFRVREGRWKTRQLRIFFLHNQQMLLLSNEKKWFPNLLRTKRISNGEIIFLNQSRKKLNHLKRPIVIKKADMLEKPTNKRKQIKPFYKKWSTIVTAYLLQQLLFSQNAPG